MNVLVTSGGTKISIDMVRSITNMSQGTFGAKIADSFYNDMRSNDKLYFLGAVDSKRPFFSEKEETDYNDNCKHICKSEGGEKFSIIKYKTFDDYEKELFKLLESVKFDVIVLSAAVSDYTVVNYVNGKIRSSQNDELVIKLKPLPKLISRVRMFQPDSIICGFKLLVNSTEEELKSACEKSLVENQVDVVVGNDLRDIKQNNHTLLIARKEGNEFSFKRFEKSNFPDLQNIVKMFCMVEREKKLEINK